MSATLPRLLLLTGCLAVAGACSARDATPATSPAKDRTMAASKTCKDDNLHRSICMVELILADLDTNYDGVGGGGIAQIKAATSTSYVVALPQEERQEQLTYEFTVEGGTVTLKSKTPDAKSY